MSARKAHPVPGVRHVAWRAHILVGCSRSRRSPAELGRAVTDALARSESGIPVPTDVKALRKRYKAAGVTSERCEPDS